MIKSQYFGCFLDTGFTFGFPLEVRKVTFYVFQLKGKNIECIYLNLSNPTLILTKPLTHNPLKSIEALKSKQCSFVDRGEYKVCRYPDL